jgi:hypothetical protein
VVIENSVNNIYRVALRESLRYAEFSMKRNIWEFLRKSDGTYAVSHNGKLLSDSIPENWFESQICEHYGFCGREYHDIRGQLDRSGKCTVDLSSSSPMHLSVS